MSCRRVVLGAPACRALSVLTVCCGLTSCFDGLIEDPGLNQGAPPGVGLPPGVPAPTASHTIAPPSNLPPAAPSGAEQPGAPTPGTPPPTTPPTASPPSDVADAGGMADDETSDVYEDTGCDAYGDASALCHDDGGSEAGSWRK